MIFIFLKPYLNKSPCNSLIGVKSTKKRVKEHVFRFRHYVILYIPENFQRFTKRPMSPWPKILLVAMNKDISQNWQALTLLKVAPPPPKLPQ
jgi:hypothetical protein